MQPLSPEPTVSFRTTLEGSATGSATGIEVPADLVEQLAHGRKPPVRVELNGFSFRTTVAVMGGRNLLPVSAEIRKQTGLKAGDTVEVRLTVDGSPREVIVPPALAAAFEQHPQAAAFFGTLSNSLQRYHVDNVDGAKSEDTRQRRVEKAIALFLAGKPR
jgi:bifunctional DNA-binding transcriptional regulator/antitoxin component of YhaV-PrlF toxin-antitoxin module